MAHTRFWKPAAVLCMLPMLLVLGLMTPYLDYMRPLVDHRVQAGEAVCAGSRHLALWGSAGSA